MPGDVFYVNYGDIYLQKEDGDFDVAQSPVIFKTLCGCPFTSMALT